MKNTILIAALTITLFTGNVFAILYVNRSCDAFNSCSPDVNGGFNPSMGQMIIEGAGYFLASHADMQGFSNKIELSEMNGLNYPGLQATLNSAIANMENAAGTYKGLIRAAKETPYNQAVIHRLMKFAYRGFMKKNHLVSDVFKKVQGFLARGDVTGAYIKLETSKDDIISRLYRIKAAVDSNLFPDINLLYQVNQAYCETLLFGQYIAQVFNNL